MRVLLGAAWHFGCGEGCAFEVEAEEGVGEQVVECGPGAVPVVSKLGMSTITGDAKVSPFLEVGL